MPAFPAQYSSTLKEDHKPTQKQIGWVVERSAGQPLVRHDVSVVSPTAVICLSCVALQASTFWLGVRNPSRERHPAGVLDDVDNAH